MPFHHLANEQVGLCIVTVEIVNACADSVADAVVFRVEPYTAHIEARIHTDRAENAVRSRSVGRQKGKNVDALFLKHRAQTACGRTGGWLCEHGLGRGIPAVDPKAQRMEYPFAGVVCCSEAG